MAAKPTDPEKNNKKNRIWLLSTSFLRVLPTCVDHGEVVQRNICLQSPINQQMMDVSHVKNSTFEYACTTRLINLFLVAKNNTTF